MHLPHFQSWRQDSTCAGLGVEVQHKNATLGFWKPDVTGLMLFIDEPVIPSDVSHLWQPWWVEKWEPLIWNEKLADMAETTQKQHATSMFWHLFGKREPSTGCSGPCFDIIWGQSNSLGVSFLFQFIRLLPFDWTLIKLTTHTTEAQDLL